MQQIKIKKLNNLEGISLPKYATSGSSGLDLAADIKSDLMLNPLQRSVIPTGIALELEKGLEAQIRPRSGLAAKKGVTVLNSPGTIDSDYRGEIKVILINLGGEPFTVQRGMRIAQIVISRYETVNVELVEEFSTSTSRGDKGFGSTGST